MPEKSLIQTNRFSMIEHPVIDQRGKVRSDMFLSIPISKSIRDFTANSGVFEGSLRKAPACNREVDLSR